MDTSVWIFNILLDIFIVYTIFAIYFYVLVKFLIHSFEENGIVGFFKTHLQFYKPILSLLKYSNNVIANPNAIPNEINKMIASSKTTYDSTDYFITDLIVPLSIVGLGLIVGIYFLFDKKKIMKQIKLEHVMFTIIMNLVLILGFECLFVFFVYGNTDLINIAKILRIE